MHWAQLTDYTNRKAMINLERVDNIVFYDNDFMVIWGDSKLFYPKTPENLTALSWHIYIQGDV